MHIFNQFDSFFDGKAVHGEISKIIAQYLHETGHSDVASVVEEQLNAYPYSEQYQHLRKAFFANDWSETDRLCRSLSAKGSDGQSSLNSVLQLVYHVAFHERLFCMKYQECLLLLRKCLDFAQSSDIPMIRKMAFDLMLRTTDVNLNELRDRHFERICECIPALEYVPRGRLLTLMEQALRWQTENTSCKTMDTLSLLTDCSRCLLRVPNKVSFTCEGHHDEVWDMSYSPNGAHLASASKDGSVFLWDTLKYRLTHKFLGHSKPVTRLKWSPDSKFLLSCSQDRTVRLWHVEVIGRHSSEATSLAWTADSSHFFTAGHDGNVFKFGQGGLFKDFWNMKTKITDMVVDCNETLHVVSVSHTIYSFNWNNPDKTTKKIFFSDDGIMAVELSNAAQHELLITLASGRLILMNAEGGEQIQSFNGFQFGKFIRRAYLCGPQDNFVLVGTDQHLIYVWNKNTGRQLAALFAEQRHINALSWKQLDEPQFASCGDNGSIM